MGWMAGFKTPTRRSARFQKIKSAQCHIFRGLAVESEEFVGEDQEKKFILRSCLIGVNEAKPSGSFGSGDIIKNI
jgi:hypothetical protein